MQKTTFLLSALLLFFTMGSCKKKKQATPADPGDFQPMTVGSEWNYTVTGTTTGSYKLSAINKDSLVNGRLYKVFTNSSGPNEYYNKTGSDYYRFANLAELNNQKVEILYLKDNLAKGLSWVETKTINIVVTGLGTVPVTAQFTFTVADKGVDYTVNSTLFKDVIKITAVPIFTANLPLPLGPTPVPVGSSDIQYFYARKVGLIYNKTALSIPTASINVNSETKLTSYTIK